jgi:hypothetical protein
MAVLVRRSAAIKREAPYIKVMMLLTAMLLFTAHAETVPAPPPLEPEQITILDETRYSRENNITRWTIDATGKGYYSGDRCKRCRKQDPYYERFELSPDIYQKVLGTLNPEILSDAQARPCTLPKAQAYGQTSFVIAIKRVRDFSIWEDNYSFFTSCQSAEIDDVKHRVTAAKAILTAAVAKDSR